MDNTAWMNIINAHIQEICHYSQLQVFATSVYQKQYFQRQIDEEVIRLAEGIINNTAPAKPEFQNGPGSLSPWVLSQELREFTREELKAYDGSGGKPAYVAVNGEVYDMTNIIQWAGGTHFGLYAGQDLTEEFMGCHNATLEILRKLPLVGVLKDSGPVPE